MQPNVRLSIANTPKCLPIDQPIEIPPAFKRRAGLFLQEIQFLGRLYLSSSAQVIIQAESRPAWNADAGRSKKLSDERAQKLHAAEAFELFQNLGFSMSLRAINDRNAAVGFNADFVFKTSGEVFFHA